MLHNACIADLITGNWLHFYAMFCVRQHLCFVFCFPPSVGTDNASDGRYPPITKSPIGSRSPQIRKRTPMVGNENKTDVAMFRKLDRKKLSDRKIEISTPPGGSSGVLISEKKHFDGDGRLLTTGEEKIQLSKPAIRRSLFDKKYENPNHGVFKNSSLTVPCGEASVVMSNETGEIYRSQQELEELSLIRKQLSQIENQQSNLLDLLQVLKILHALAVCKISICLLLQRWYGMYLVFQRNLWFTCVQKDTSILVFPQYVTQLLIFFFMAVRPD